jgi:hypothetical protein
MLEIVILLGLCVLVALSSVLVVIWLAISGSLLSVDGISFALISLTIGGFFAFNIGWSLYSGELRELLGSLRKNKSPGNSEKDSEAASAHKS